MLEFSQFVAGGPAEVGVQNQYFDGELHLVDDTLARTVVRTEQFEIFDAVVKPISIDVMNGFVGEQIAPNALLHNISVLENFMKRLSISRRNTKHDVLSFDSPSYLRKSVSLSMQLAYPFVLTLLTAYFLLNIDTPAWVAVAGAFFAAVYADKFVFFFCALSIICGRAGHRAISWITVKFFTIRSQIRLHHNERLAAFFAGEVHRSATSRGQRFYGTVVTSAGKTAIFTTSFSIARVAVERVVAVLADHFDRHCYAPLVGTAGLALSFEMVK